MKNEELWSGDLSQKVLAFSNGDCYVTFHVTSCLLSLYINCFQSFGLTKSDRNRSYAMQLIATSQMLKSVVHSQRYS